MSNERTKFPATDRRINYLRQELYTYDKFFRDPSSDTDVGKHAKFAIDADDHQKELDELMYLRDLAEKTERPTGIKRWQAGLIAFYATTALAVAALSLWLAMVR